MEVHLKGNYMHKYSSILRTPFPFNTKSRNGVLSLPLPNLPNKLKRQVLPFGPFTFPLPPHLICSLDYPFLLENIALSAISAILFLTNTVKRIRELSDTD